MNARLAAPAHRLEDRHRQRHRVRAAGGRGGLRRRRARRRERHLRPLRGDPLQRQALSQRVAPGLEVLRRARPPGARAPGAGERRAEPLRRRAGARARGAGRRDARPRPCRSTATCSVSPSRARSFPAGPGDAPVDGPDETLESGGAPVVRVEDDPHGGVPIEIVASEEADAKGTARRLTRSGPARGAAARRRRASSSASMRWTDTRTRRRPGARRVHLPPARVLRARDRAPCVQPNAAPDRDRRPRSRAALHLRS